MILGASAPFFVVDSSAATMKFSDSATGCEVGARAGRCARIRKSGKSLGTAHLVGVTRGVLFIQG